MKKSILIFTFLSIIFLSSCKINEITVSPPKNLSIEKLSLQEIKLKLFLPVENPNKFSFKVKESDLFLYVNENKIGKINTKNFTTISSKSEAAYPIYFEIKPTDVVSNVKILFKELGKKKPELYIKGDIIVKKFPIRKKIPVNYKIER